MLQQKITDLSVRCAIYVSQRFPGVFRFLHRTRAFLVCLVRPISPRFLLRIGPPRSNISLYKLLKLRDGSVKGRILFDSQPTTPLTPGTLSAYWKIDQASFQPYPAFWSFHRNAHLVTKTLGLLIEGKRLALESTYRNSLWHDSAYNYFWLPPAVKLQGNYTSIVSLWNKSHTVANFSHWLLDALPRLAPLEEFPRDTVVLTPGNLANYQVETLRLLGLEKRFRPTHEQHLLVENYYFSSPTSLHVRENVHALQFLRKNFLPKASAGFKGPKRFIIDRAGLTRGLLNRKEFNQFFEDLGWAIIDPGSFSFADEIKLFADAEAYAGPIGSGFTNAVWSQPGCAVLQIVPHNCLEPSTEWICQRNKLRWRFIVCEGDANLRVTVDLRDVKKTLKELGLL
jgi:hypothetical protein